MYAANFKFNNLTGWLIFSEKGLYSLQLPKVNAKQPLNTIFKTNSTIKQLEAYFKGQKITFNVKIDWSFYSDFEKKTLEQCRLVGYGKTITYKELAYKTGNGLAYRAVGNALGKNRLPVIIPCHRILKSDGKLGGFSSGLENKKILLDLEKNG